MLFDPHAHERPADGRWDAGAIAAAIRAIARDAEDHLPATGWWPVHPLDAEPGDPEVFHGVYLGAAGVVWALERLARLGLHEPRRDHRRLALEVLDSYRREPELDGPLPSLWLGEGGITLVAWRLSRREALAVRLAELVDRDLDGDTLELMWGSPGLLVIAGAMRAGTGGPRFAAAAERIAAGIMRQWGARVTGFWTQKLYGDSIEYLGPAHGLAGVVVALARSGVALEHDFVAGVTEALASTAIREGGYANWPPSLQEPLTHRTGTIRTQWCHGAPGIVASFAALPRADVLDSLLIAGGELTWAAGPLRKGAGLSVRSHYGHGRHTLWTGDLGTALFLEQCLAGGSEMPGLDAW